jgi:hypothetical protein
MRPFILSSVAREALDVVLNLASLAVFLAAIALLAKAAGA